MEILNYGWHLSIDFYDSLNGDGDGTIAMPMPYTYDCIVGHIQRSKEEKVENQCNAYVKPQASSIKTVLIDVCACVEETFSFVFTGWKQRPILAGRSDNHQLLQAAAQAGQ